MGVTHGDEKLIGGWDCSRESLQDPLRQEELSHWMRETGIDVFATTHTCSPAAMMLADGAVINNGAAGLPNFSGQDFGIVARISTTPAKEALFGIERKGVHIEAVPLRYDQAAYVEWFDALWTPASPAAISYRDRIVGGRTTTSKMRCSGAFLPVLRFAKRPFGPAFGRRLEMWSSRLLASCTSRICWKPST